MSAKGKFIALEGGEGVGKSTQAKALAEALKQCGVDVLVTREPGGSSGAERIRELLLGADAEWDARAEALLFAAARADHVAKLIPRVTECLVRAGPCKVSFHPGDVYNGLLHRLH